MLELELTGVAPMFYITFKKDTSNTYRGRRDDFYTLLIRRGIFLHPHHHGYISYRHTEQDLDITANAIDEALAYVNEKYPKQNLLTRLNPRRQEGPREG